jgi:putative peptidoglycan lipid II flippase
VRILFQHGRFDPAATRLTAEVLVWFLAGSFAFAAYTVVVRGYFATRDTLFPALFGTLAVLASIPLYPLGLAFMGVKGVALAVSVSGVLQVVILYALWNRRSGNTGQVEVFRFYLKIALVSLVIGLALAGFRSVLTTVVDPSGLPGSLAVAALVGALFAGLMILAGYGLKIREITELAGRILKRGGGA